MIDELKSWVSESKEPFFGTDRGNLEGKDFKELIESLCPMVDTRQQTFIARLGTAFKVGFRAWKQWMKTETTW